MARPEVEDDRVVLAVDVATILPELEDAGAIRSRPKEGPRGRNRFIFIGCRKFGSPDDLAVSVEQVATVFERPWWRPQR